MNEKELKKYVEVNNLKMTESADEYFIQDNVWGSSIGVMKETLEGNTTEQFDVQLHKGENVEQITRVTGYFSKVSSGKAKGWNPGKAGELDDRHKNTL